MPRQVISDHKKEQWFKQAESEFLNVQEQASFF
jgi:hypothetical protein